MNRRATEKVTEERETCFLLLSLINVRLVCVCVMITRRIMSPSTRNFAESLSHSPPPQESARGSRGGGGEREDDVIARKVGVPALLSDRRSFGADRCFVFFVYERFTSGRFFRIDSGRSLEAAKTGKKSASLPTSIPLSRRRISR